MTSDTPSHATPPDGPRDLLDTLTGPVTARNVVLQVLSGLAVGGVVFGSAAAAATLASGGSDGPREELRAAFLTGGSVDGRQSQFAAEALGWDVTALVNPRAGIGSQGRGQPTPLAKLARTEGALLDAEVIVIQGGEADTRMPPEGLGVAAAHMLDWLAANAEGASVVLAGPIPGSDQSPRDLVGANQVLRTIAAEKAVPYLDALDSGLTRTSSTLGEDFAEALLPLVPAAD